MDKGGLQIVHQAKHEDRHEQSDDHPERCGDQESQGDHQGEDCFFFSTKGSNLSVKQTLPLKNKGGK
jgi:hypothetical protein